MERPQTVKTKKGEKSKRVKGKSLPNQNWQDCRQEEEPMDWEDVSFLPVVSALSVSSRPPRKMRSLISVKVNEPPSISANRFPTMRALVPKFTCRNCGGGDRGRVAIYRPFGEVSLSLNRTVTCMVLKANDRRTSCPCHDEFRGPRSDYVRQTEGGVSLHSRGCPEGLLKKAASRDQSSRPPSGVPRATLFFERYLRTITTMSSLKLTRQVGNPDFAWVVRAELAVRCFVSYNIANTVAIIRIKRNQKSPKEGNAKRKQYRSGTFCEKESFDKQFGQIYLSIEMDILEVLKK
ncbi:uncharacterized protein TNCV_4924691 [Trichonephila clavipes]|nr:uncharacterized protein TNCV_4924691 [Trichonephila clavipes]